MNNQNINSAHSISENKVEYQVLKDLSKGYLSNVSLILQNNRNLVLKEYHQVEKKQKDFLSSMVLGKMSDSQIKTVLKHENLMKIVEIHKKNGLIEYIKSEYLGDVKLLDILANRQNSMKYLNREYPVQCLFYFSQILKGVKHLHDNNYAHRDIKASNILINKEEAGIIDLDYLSEENTDTKIHGYSLEYTSPQQFFNNTVKLADDLFSLGCLFSEMLSGTVPLYVVIEDLINNNKIKDNINLKNRSNSDRFMIIERLGKKIKEYDFVNLLVKNIKNLKKDEIKNVTELLCNCFNSHNTIYSIDSLIAQFEETFY